jgi:hypothetical protein
MHAPAPPSEQYIYMGKGVRTGSIDQGFFSFPANQHGSLHATEHLASSFYLSVLSFFFLRENAITLCFFSLHRRRVQAF